ncbi:MAG: hypothetical protein FJX77_00915 [Armatimonadetes bacterium]|nr:hypothetical protein [Armatimonadota bacterium]
MTGLDILFVLLLVIQLLSLVGLALAGRAFLGTFREVQRLSAPARSRASALAERGRRFGLRCQALGLPAGQKAGRLARQLQGQARRYRRLIQEIVGPAQEILRLLRDPRPSSPAVAAVRRGSSLLDLVRGLGRVRTAAVRAVSATRPPAAPPQSTSRESGSGA